jgi:tetratricopeptide (TPR) repeat protein
VYAGALVDEGEELAWSGEVISATLAFSEAVRLDPKLEISVGSWHTLCWGGSVWEQPDEVLYACENALRRQPDNGKIRDSRGLARALTGDYEGAIEDFSAFVEWAEEQDSELYAELIAQRKAWIEALQRGENPFTAEVLRELRNDL